MRRSFCEKRKHTTSCPFQLRRGGRACDIVPHTYAGIYAEYGAENYQQETRRHEKARKKEEKSDEGEEKKGVQLYRTGP